MLGEQILLINRRRRRRGSRARAASGRFIRRGRTRSRRAATTRRRRRRNPVGAFMPAVVNRRRRRRSIVSRIVRRRRRNPRFGGFTLRGVTRQVIPAAIGGAGALGLDMALAVLPVPDMLKSGPLAILTKIGGAIGLGWLAGMVVGRENGRLVTTGALTVVAYNVIKGFAQQVAPQLPGLSDYEDYRAGMGAFMNRQNALGFVDPAPVLRGVGAYSAPTSRDETALGCDDGFTY